MQSVNEHIDDICYDAKWRKPFRETFRMSDSEAQKLTYYKEGDTFYKYCNEAPNDAVRKSFEVIPRDGKSLEEYLNKRNCIIHIDGSDLIIQKVSEKNVSGDDNRKYSCSSKNSGICHLPNSFASIDFETLYPQRVSVCSIGMVKYLNGNIVDRYYSLIQPPLEYPGKKGTELTWVHGITKDMLIGKKTFDEILPDIEAFVGNLPLVAHNASVESSCIREVCTYYGITTKLDYRHIYDTLAISKVAEEATGLKIEGSGTHSLDKVCERFHVTVKNHHNALDDAEMCGDLMKIFYQILVEHQHLVGIEDKPSEPIGMEIPLPKEEKKPVVGKSYSENAIKDNNKTGCLGVLIVFITTLFFVCSII
jgi:DNA polymerase III epsilon subunit-like protein